MNFKPFIVALRGKGLAALLKRIRVIYARYGFTTVKMERALALLTHILQQYACGASLPITAAALSRHGWIIQKYQAHNIEFAIHGLYHVDHSLLPADTQRAHIGEAQQIFAKKDIKLAGFRSPYLRWNHDTLTAVAVNQVSYDSSRALYWDVVGPHATPAYHHVLEFYRAESAQDYPALPKIVNSIVQIPYCLPDDEALIERLQLTDAGAMSCLWLAMLEQTHARGELFTLGLHPERIALLQQPLAQTLARARSLSPRVWLARLDEIAQWWQARRKAAIAVTDESASGATLTVSGPPGLTVLARNIEVDAPTAAGPDGFEQVQAVEFSFKGQTWPCIGLSPDSSPVLGDFLAQQGYWLETMQPHKTYALELDLAEFTDADERPLLQQLTHTKVPLMRLGRWPNGAQSALCVTGDIDALTLWDYGLRFLGR